MKCSCWCYATKRQVIIEGEPAGKRQAELLKVTNCEHKKTCPTAYAVDCLINKIREGRW